MRTGTPLAVPNWKLHNIIETSGGAVVCEEMCTGTRYFENLVDESKTTLDEQFMALSERYMKTNCACFTPNTVLFLYKNPAAAAFLGLYGKTSGKNGYLPGAEGKNSLKKAKGRRSGPLSGPDEKNGIVFILKCNFHMKYKKYF